MQTILISPSSTQQTFPGLYCIPNFVWGLLANFSSSPRSRPLVHLGRLARPSDLADACDAYTSSCWCTPWLFLVFNFFLASSTGNFLICGFIPHLSSDRLSTFSVDSSQIHLSTIFLETVALTFLNLTFKRKLTNSFRVVLRIIRSVGSSLFYLPTHSSSLSPMSFLGMFI